MLKKIPVQGNQFELRDHFDQPVINLTSVPDGDGTLRVMATINGDLANDIIDGLKLLEAVRSAVPNVNLSAKLARQASLRG